MKRRLKDRCGWLKLMTLAVIMLFWGCHSRTPLKVLLVHQYDSSLSGYEEFDKTIIREFRKAGFSPEIHNLYLHLEDQASSDSHMQLSLICDSLRKTGWEADVILGEGNRALHQWFHEKNINLPAWRKKAVTVFGGIWFHEVPGESKLPNTYILYDYPDFPRTIDMLSRLSGERTIEIELDHYYEDSLIYELMNHQVGNDPYALTRDSLGRVYGILESAIMTEDSITLSIHSAEWFDPRNAQDTLGARSVMSNWQSQSDLDDVYLNAWRYPVLVVKKDVWGDAIANKTYRPQYTICRELFNDDRGSYLCGIFASYETVALDMVRVAVQVLKEGHASHHNKHHEPNQYMDYRAMERLGLSYDDYKGDFVIVNAPLMVRNPLLFILLVVISIVSIVLLLALLFFGNRVYIKNHRNSLRSLYNRLEEETKMSQLAIDASGNFYISSVQDLMRVLDNMGPEQDKCKESIMASLREYGTHTHEYRILAAMDEDKNMVWWNLRYMINHPKMSDLDLEGYLLNVNEDVNYAEEMVQIQSRAEASKETEGFFWTMAHEIRTPLNAIVGFCDIIRTMGNNLDSQELDTIKKGIEDNNLLLEQIITNMDNYSRVTSGGHGFEAEEISLDEFVHDLYLKYRDGFTDKNLTFAYTPGRDASIMANRELLRVAMKQLIDNALKFTHEGSVALGWTYSLSLRQVELFVADSGIGLTPQDCLLIYDEFWKKDTFVAGAGLGLSLVSACAKTLGTEVKVESEPNVGSRFSLYFDVVYK